MRGRTLNESFVILDEAQNTTPEQMKMFLTRIGFGSTAVITGDVTQIDLPRGQLSGLRQAIEVLAQVDGISFTFFNARDVVRHPLVQRVVRAYEEFDRHRVIKHRTGYRHDPRGGNPERDRVCGPAVRGRVHRLGAGGTADRTGKRSRW